MSNLWVKMIDLRNQLTKRWQTTLVIRKVIVEKGEKFHGEADATRDAAGVAGGQVSEDPMTYDRRTDETR
jgi:hypothetical protein